MKTNSVLLKIREAFAEEDRIEFDNFVNQMATYPFVSWRAAIEASDKIVFAWVIEKSNLLGLLNMSSSMSGTTLYLTLTKTPEMLRVLETSEPAWRATIELENLKAWVIGNDEFSNLPFEGKKIAEIIGETLELVESENKPTSSSASSF
jgi:hypothetical protein